MPVDVTVTLRRVLKRLQTEKTHLEAKIAAIETVLAAGRPGGARKRTPAKRAKAGSRKPMSAVARRAASRRMKAYWKRRRAAE